MTDEDKPTNPFDQTPSSNRYYKKHRFDFKQFVGSVSVILIVLALFYAVFALRYDPLLTKNAYIIGGAPAQSPAQAPAQSPAQAPAQSPAAGGQAQQGQGGDSGSGSSPIVNPPVESPYVPQSGGSSGPVCSPCAYDGACQICCSSDPDCPVEKATTIDVLKNNAGDLPQEIVLKIKQVLAPKVVFSSHLPTTNGDGLGAVPVDVKRTLTVTASQAAASGFVSRVELKAVNKGSSVLPTLIIQERITAIEYAGSSYKNYPNVVFNPIPTKIEKGSVIVTWLFDNVGPQDEVEASYELDGKLSKDDLNNMQAPRIVTNLQSGEEIPIYEDNLVKVQPNNVAPTVPAVQVISTQQKESNINLILLLSLLLALDVAAYYYVRNRR